MRRDRFDVGRCEGRSTRRAARCQEQRLHRIVPVTGGGSLSVLTMRPRCLVIAPTVAGWGRA